MKPNVGTIDQAIRFVIGLAILSLFFFLEGGIKYISLIGFIPLITALIRFCPIYAILGKDTTAKQ